MGRGVGAARSYTFCFVLFVRGVGVMDCFFEGLWRLREFVFDVFWGCGREWGMSRFGYLLIAWKGGVSFSQPGDREGGIRPGCYWWSQGRVCTCIVSCLSGTAGGFWSEID